MAKVGQIVYNVQDYQTSGGYISTSNSNLNSTISSNDNPSYNEAKIDIFNSNIVQKFGKSFTKLGVQSPPGTRFILNTNKTILVGRSGIYELDNDISITSLQFVRPRKYVKDVGASDQYLNEGMEGLKGAEDLRASKLNALNADRPSKDKVYWEKYTKIQSDYDIQYQEALLKFNMGLNGIYKLPDKVEDRYQDLYNVIIDFLY